MRRIALTGFTLLLTACGGGEKQAADTATVGEAPAAAPAPAAPAPLALADVAGTWDMRSTPMSGDTTPTLSVLKATGADTGWTMTFPGRKPVPVRVVSVAGDSVVTQAGPFESVRRKGVQVTTDQVLRLSEGKLVGTVVAHYRVDGPDSVLTLRSEGTRKP